MIEVKNLVKKYGNHLAVDHLDFQIKPGMVYGFLGPNGAGKSTLMKILTGVYTKDAGTVLVDGKEVNYKNPQEAEKAGIVFIYQELNVMFDLTVEENLFMGKEIHGKFGICDRKAMQKKAREALNTLGVDISPKTVMSELSVGQQQMVEICKALMADAKVIIMDEPTAALTQSETVALFKVIQISFPAGICPILSRICSKNLRIRHNSASLKLLNITFSTSRLCCLISSTILCPFSVRYTRMTL